MEHCLWKSVSAQIRLVSGITALNVVWFWSLTLPNWSSERLYANLQRLLLTGSAFIWLIWRIYFKCGTALFLQVWIAWVQWLMVSSMVSRHDKRECERLSSTTSWEPWSLILPSTTTPMQRISNSLRKKLDSAKEFYRWTFPTTNWWTRDHHFKNQSFTTKHAI